MDVYENIFSNVVSSPITDTNPYDLPVTVTSTQLEQDYFLTQIDETVKAFLLAEKDMIPDTSLGIVLGDHNNDGGIDLEDVKGILQDKGKPLTGGNDPRDINGDGRISILDARELGLKIRNNSDQFAPFLIVSSLSFTDDPLIEGVLMDESQITRFSAGLNNTPFEDYRNIRGILRPDGTFSLNTQKLRQLNNNSPLEDGEYTLHLFAKDQWNNQTTADIGFILDTTAPEIEVGLLFSSGISNSGKIITFDPTLTGTITDLTDIVSFEASLRGTTVNITDLIDSEGNFTIDWTILQQLNNNLPLTEGGYSISFTATDIAGNISDPLTFDFVWDFSFPSFDLITDLNQPITENTLLVGTAFDKISGINQFTYRFDNGEEIEIIVDEFGNFSQPIDLTGINNGGHTFEIFISDIAGFGMGIRQPVEVTVIEIIIIITPPTFNFNLLEDTGISNNDWITQNPIIIGNLVNDNNVISFTASLNSQSNVSIFDLVQEDGSFILDESVLARLNGNQPLTDGFYLYDISAEYSAVNGIGFGVGVLGFLTLDTQPPQLTLNTPLEGVELTQGDSLSGNIDGTIAESFFGPRLGMTSLSYRFDDQAEIAITLDENGNFDQLFDLTGLAQGSHVLTITGVDIAGNISLDTFNIVIPSPNNLSLIEEDQGLTFIRPLI